MPPSSVEECSYKRKPQRDVVSTGTPGDNVTIRFVTDNAGPWFLHWYVKSISLYA